MGQRLQARLHTCLEHAGPLVEALPSVALPALLGYRQESC